jgi:hypothetical protein
MKLSYLLLKDIDKIYYQQGMMTIVTGGRDMHPTCNSSYGITGIWELVREGLFPVVVCEKLETNIRIGLASTVALWEEDLDTMNGSCITFKY